MELADQIVLMNQGRVEQAGGARDLYDRPANDFVMTFIGPAGAFCASLDDDGRAALHDGLKRRLGVGDEPFTLTARAWAVAGR